MRSAIAAATLLLSALAAGAPGRASAVEAPPARAANIRQLEKQLDSLEQERRDNELSRPFGWEQNDRPFVELGREVKVDDESSIVELRYDARQVPCFVTLRDVDDGDVPERRAPMVIRGSQWMRLRPGNWEIRIYSGYATGPIVEFDPATVQVQRGKVYRLTFGTDQEEKAKDLMREKVAAEREVQKPGSVTVTIPR